MPFWLLSDLHFHLVKLLAILVSLLEVADSRLEFLGGASRVTLRFCVSYDGYLLNVPGVNGIELTRANIGNGIFIQHDACPHSFAKRKRLIVLLKSTVFAGVVHSFVLDLGVLGKEAFENLVSSACVDVLATN